MRNDVVAWYHLEYRLDTNSAPLIITFNIKTTEQQLWKEISKAHKKGDMLLLPGRNGTAGFPASRLIAVDIRPCKPHEIPEGEA